MPADATDPASGLDLPTRAEVARRRAAALAGHTGDGNQARAGLDDPSPRVRASALGAQARLGQLALSTLARAATDGHPTVRRRACEIAALQVRDGGWASATVLGLLVTATSDDDAGVVESACFALGELGMGGAVAEALVALEHVTRAHDDPLCREAAVAALGAIGDPAGLPAILAATNDKPAVRRRAVLALAPFEGPEVDGALARALTDRDWQVRQAAEDLTATD
jgi:HEAT repeat protein